MNFTSDSKVVAKGQELAEGASSDLEVITRIYDYIITACPEAAEGECCNK